MYTSSTQKSKTMFLLGGSGFIGRQVINEAVKLGWQVKALVRSDQSAEAVKAAGGLPVLGDGDAAKEWVSQVAGTNVLLDLLQPKLSVRIGRKKLLQVSNERQSITKGLLEALRSIPDVHRPTLISVSGIDDLGADTQGVISAQSPIRSGDYGLNGIGIPVRRLIEQSRLRATYVYFGTVYGPGKAFAASIFPSVEAGKWKNFGTKTGRMALIHVEDAAQGLVYVAEMEDAQRLGKSFVVVDDCQVDMDSFFATAATLMKVASPGRVPRWLASLFAGRALVETMICETPVDRTRWADPDFSLRFPSYREGLPFTLKMLGYPKNKAEIPPSI